MKLLLHFKMQRKLDFMSKVEVSTNFANVKLHYWKRYSVTFLIRLRIAVNIVFIWLWIDIG